MCFICSILLGLVLKFKRRRNKRALRLRWLRRLQQEPWLWCVPDARVWCWALLVTCLVEIVLLCWRPIHAFTLLSFSHIALLGALRQSIDLFSFSYRPCLARGGGLILDLPSFPLRHSSGHWASIQVDRGLYVSLLHSFGRYASTRLLVTRPALGVETYGALWEFLVLRLLFLNFSLALSLLLLDDLLL